MKFVAILLILVVSAISCEKTIDLKPKSLDTELVVDGTIEDGLPPVIFLSRSLDYFSAINPAILSGSQVHNAKVIVSDGVNTHQLREYTQAIGSGYSISYYTSDSANLATAITGQQGKKYTLSIEVNGKQYTSETNIPVLDKKLESLWWKKVPGNSDSTRVTVMTKTADPKGFGDYIRYFTKVNNGSYLPGLNSVFDDQIVDGSTYEIQVDQGINRNDPPESEDYGYFEKGDTVMIKFCNIDKSTFDFWRTLEYSYQSVGNPFSSPTTILGNITNGALGAFCGYSVQYKSLIIPK